MQQQASNQDNQNNRTTSNQNVNTNANTASNKQQATSQQVLTKEQAQVIAQITATIETKTSASNVDYIYFKNIGDHKILKFVPEKTKKDTVNYAKKGEV